MVFRCFRVAWWWVSDSPKMYMFCRITADVHEIVSISPHNLVYAILICPMLRHKSCIELPPETCQGYLTPVLYLLSLPYLSVAKDLQSTSSNASPLFIMWSKIHPDWHKIYHRHCKSQCDVAILRTMCSYKRYNDYEISHLQNWYAHVSFRSHFVTTSYFCHCATQQNRVCTLAMKSSKKNVKKKFQSVIYACACNVYATTKFTSSQSIH